MAKKRKKRLTAAQRKARKKRKAEFKIVFINGKQKRVRRPTLIEGLPAEEFIRRNADPLWLHQNGHWDLLNEESDAPDSPDGTG